MHDSRIEQDHGGPEMIPTVVGGSVTTPARDFFSPKRTASSFIGLLFMNASFISAFGSAFGIGAFVKSRKPPIAALD